MPPAMNTPKRLAVRLMLATGSTFAAIIGAQSLAMQQTPQTNTDAVELPLPATTLPLLPTPVPTMTSVTIAHAAPSITILRMPGQAANLAPVDTVSQAASADSTAPQAAVENAAIQQHQIAPPNPVVLAAPPPVVMPSDPVYVQAPPIVQAVQNSNSGGGSNNSGSSSSGHSKPKTHSSK